MERLLSSRLLFFRSSLRFPSSLRIITLPIAIVAIVAMSSRPLLASDEHPEIARPQPLATDTTEGLIAPDGIAVRLPSNLKVPAKLQSVLEEVLRRSPTFRRQVQELRHTPHVRMTLSYGNLSIWHVLRAESRISKYEWGSLAVDTRLYTVENVIEVIAHELEHVCEQIEGIDVRVLAHQRHSGVYDVGGHYETHRAVLAGRQVAKEALGLTADDIVASNIHN
jgi:hypothetical protein